MRKVTTVEGLEAIVGTPRQIVLMKQIDALDDGCRSVLANAPVAGFGFCDSEGIARTTLIGGVPGFARVDSPTRISFDLREGQPGPVTGGGVSLVFLLPGVGETLRLNGSVVERSGTSVVIHLEEAFVHCARSILRSGLWDDVRADLTAARVESQLGRDDETAGPLAGAAVAGFLVSSPFAAVSTWNAEGSSDTSPRGDRPGFLRVLDSQTLALPDRRGNQRADTFHNVLACDRISLAAVIPGRDDVLHMSGTAYVTDDPALLSTMAVGEKPPQAALIVRVERADIVANEAVRTSRMWHRSAHIHPGGVPDLMGLATQHLANNKARGVKASLTRALTRGLAASPGLLRRAIDLGYRKELEDEGY
jgi:predicted pyridoxine 5'-phosphate oxidase superfamily flavin-nucleotide-binding protein